MGTTTAALPPLAVGSRRQRFHEALYLGLQAARGRPVGACMRQLREWERLDRSSFRKLTQERLRDALRRAAAQVPLYGTSEWREASVGQRPDEIRAWPVLERDVVRTRGAELMARQRPLGMLYRHSSASTGAPLSVAYNPKAAAWSWAGEHRAALWHGVPLGAKMLMMWGHSHTIVDWIKNSRVFNAKELNASRLDEAARWFVEERPEVCMGLPSAVARLARHVRANYPQARESLCQFAKLGGEQVYPFQREEIARHLGARVIDFYGCTEVGAIAAECPAGSRHVFSEIVHVEVMRGDELLPAGEKGDLVITSLTNRAMPLVRCRIGDRGTLSPDPCSCGLPHPVLAELEGRAADLFAAADGRLVHGSALGDGLKSFLAGAPAGAVGQVLFRQADPHHWDVLVETGDGFDDALANRLRELVRSTFGKACAVEIRPVDTVPRERSGKFRYYSRNPN
jgi:phenylacetate-CoA ligase